MATQITGKTVVVTGGSRGIGLGLVRRFLERRNTVIATSRKAADAQQLQQLQQQFGAAQLHLTDLDTASQPSIAAWAGRVKGLTPHVDVLVNNAGVYGRRPVLGEFEEQDFLFSFTTNAMGPFFVVQELLKQGLLGPPGSLVANMSSIMASNSDPTVSTVTKGGYAYRASKAALNAVSTTLARDLADQQVQCVLLHPGYVKTDMTGGNGWVDVEESTAGLLAVLESGRTLSGRFISYKGDEIPW